MTDTSHVDFTTLMPEMSEDEYQQLKADIAANGGILVPVEVDEQGQVLDGRHRIRACQELGITDWPVIVRKFDSDEARVEHVLSLNLERRHLDKRQRQEVVKFLREQGWTLQRIAEKLNVNVATAHRAAVIANAKTDRVIGSDGKSYPTTKLRTPAVLVNTPKQQEQAARLLTEHEVNTDVPIIDFGRARKEVRTEQRQAKVAQIASKAVADAATVGTYSVLYADPPWRYDGAELTRQVENNYPTMSHDEMLAMTVPAADDSVLFMWATSPLLPQALEVMAAWGFDYRTCMVWVKDKIGMGYYARQRHELVLIGKRGNLPVPEAPNRPDSVQEAPRTEHSAKPHVFYDLIEAMYPEYPKIELFARNARDGWASWGNQA